MMQPRILIILPALNEGENIGRVITNIRATAPHTDILVINDGSADNTGRVATQAGAIVLHMPYNVGIGAAVQTGFKFARNHNYDYVIRNDGDGQHNAQNITQLIETLAQHNADVVVGSRFIADGDYGTPIARRLGIIILSRLLSIITGWRVTDPTSGFAAFNRRAIALFARRYPHDYPEPESIVVLHRCGLKMVEIPVQMHTRQGGKSSITPVRSAYYMVKVIFAILINMIRSTPIITEP